ncbi:MAG: hypothetical protein HYX27_09135 [Acidobacteria bacterium]|nr:hypothetical protein [Acidobacteriota bacterium]
MVSKESIGKTRRRLEHLANESRGEYDGWEAAAMREVPPTSPP